MASSWILGSARRHTVHAASMTRMRPAVRAVPRGVGGADFDVSSDIGRPIAHFARKFSDENLLLDAETVLKKLTPIETEVPSDAGRWYGRRMLPYRTRDNHIAVVVVTFSDVTERKRAADAVNEARIYSEAVVETVRQPLLVLDGALRVQSANVAFYDQFQVKRHETEGRLVYELGNSQ